MMAHTRFWKPAAVLCLLPMPLVLGRAAASAQAPATGKAKVDRLVLGLIMPSLDSLRPWINGTADHNSQHDSAFEWLVEVDAQTGASKPWLAESWTLGADGRSWHVTLQQGVLSQHGYGAFTARDVVHTPALWCNERDPGRKAPHRVATARACARSSASWCSTTTRS